MLEIDFAPVKQDKILITNYKIKHYIFFIKLIAALENVWFKSVD